MEAYNDKDDLNGVAETLSSFSVGPNYNESVFLLSQMFPNLLLKLIRETLEENCGSFDKSCDVLLNYSVIEENLENNVNEVPKIDSSMSFTSHGEKKPVEKPSIQIANMKVVSNSEFPKELETEGNFLRELFPNIPAAVIIRQLRTDGKDMVKLYDSLINFDVVSSRPKLTKIKLDLSNQDSRIPNIGKTWEQLNDEVSTICDLTDASKLKAGFYYHKTNSVILAVILIIENEPHLITPSLSTQLKPIIGPIKMTSSRVQMNSKSMTKKRRSSSSSSSSSLSDQDSSVSNYLFDPANEEAQQLENYKLNNPKLFLIYDQFYIKLMNYFQGDCKRVIGIADLIIKNNACKFTFPDSVDLENYELYNFERNDKAKEKPIMEIANKRLVPKVQKGITTSDYLKKSDHFTRMAKETSEKAVKGFYMSLASENKSLAHYSRIDQEKILQSKIIGDYLRTNKLDLHGLSVEIALDAVSKVLGDWWSDELLRREQLGKRLKSGKVQEVDALVIITGRGLHSAGGKSKLKVAVRKYLVSNRFLFDEGTSTFTVDGKSQA